MKNNSKSRRNGKPWQNPGVTRRHLMLYRCESLVNPQALKPAQANPLHSIHPHHNLHNAYQAHHWCTFQPIQSPASDSPRQHPTARATLPTATLSQTWSKATFTDLCNRCSVEVSSSIFPSLSVCLILPAIEIEAEREQSD